MKYPVCYHCNNARVKVGLVNIIRTEPSILYLVLYVYCVRRLCVYCITII